MSKNFNSFSLHQYIRIRESRLQTESCNLQVPGGGGFLRFLLRLKVIAFPLPGGATLDQVPLVPVVR